MDGKMVAVSNFSALVGKSTAAGGGLNGVVQWLPINQVAETLVGLYQARDQAKNTLYEMSGISDIVRGQVDPREKASQSKIKAGFATQRLDQRRRAVERTARDAARIQVELMAELYSPDTIRQQSGFDLMREMEGLEPDVKEQVWEQVMQTPEERPCAGLPGGRGNGQHRRDGRRADPGSPDRVPYQRRELPQQRAPGDAVLAGLDAAHGRDDALCRRGYRAGRTLESAFEEAVQDIKERLEQQQQAEQQGPPPDPAAEAEAAAIQQKMQIEGAKGQAQLQAQQQKGQVEAQKVEMEAQKGQLELAQEQAKLQAMVQQQALELEKLKAQVKAAKQTVQ